MANGIMFSGCLCVYVLYMYMYTIHVYIRLLYIINAMFWQVVFCIFMIRFPQIMKNLHTTFFKIIVEVVYSLCMTSWIYLFLSKALLLTFQDLYIFVDCWALSSVSVFTPWLPSVRPAVAAAAAGRCSVSPDEQPQQSDHVQWDPEQPHHQQPEHQPKPRATVPWPLLSASHTEKGLCPNILLQRPTLAFWFWR